MQYDPEKTTGNYNEYQGAQPGVASEKGLFRLELDNEQQRPEAEQVVRTGVELVNARIDEILGKGNKLTGRNFDPPTVRFAASLPEYPNWSGYFSPDKNMITIITGKIVGLAGQTKVFIHEYIHFLSHNGWDEGEQLDLDSPIAEGNNVGFRRFFGLDIREGKKGKVTSDYFLAFNEAVTEQLAIDIFPDVHETYADYRGLFNQVLDDAVVRGLGSRD